MKPEYKLIASIIVSILFILPSATPIARALTFTWGSSTQPVQMPLTQASQTCVQCHMYATPFVVRDWQKSMHYYVGTGCYECHGVDNPESRPDAFNHYGYWITFVVTPKQCGRCHPTQAEEFTKSVHAFAGLHAYGMKEYPSYWTILANVFQWEEGDIVPEDYIATDWVPQDVRDYVGDQQYGIKVFEEDPTNAIVPFNPLEKSNMKVSVDHYDMTGALYLWGIRGCLACHGVNMMASYAIAEKTTTSVKFDPAFITNHGIGRINPDGSLGSCEACHPFHSFSIKIARKGSFQACGRCHTGPDHPNDEQWSKSVHGAIFWGEAEDWNWDARPNNWRPGIDFRAPTCPVCHMAAVFDEQGNLKYASSHDVAITCKFKLGRWRMTIPRLAGYPDPAIPGSGYVYPAPDWKERRQRMIDTCSQCHSKYFAASWLKVYDYMIILVDYMRDEYVVTVEKMLKDHGLYTPVDKYMVRNLGAMANRPTKMAAAHFGPDFTWWEGIMHFAGEIAEWLTDVYERPAVRQQAPEVIEKIEEILPWLKTMVEGEGTGYVANIEQLVAKLPGFQEYAAKKYNINVEYKPSVEPVSFTAIHSVSSYTVNTHGYTAMSMMPLLVLPLIPAAIAVRRRK